MSISGATRGPRDLFQVPGTPPDRVWVYQIGFPAQISSTEVGMFTNIRVACNPIVDLEAGTDLLIFDRLDQISPDRVTPLERVRLAKHPRSGEPIHLIGGVMGGFVPLGARREDGSPHPHAGTGFSCGLVMGYPAALAAQDDTNMDFKSDIYSALRVQQYVYDGHEITVTSSEEIPHDALLPGWNVIEHGFSAALPSGDDLVCGLSTGTVLQWDSGFSRWRRIDGRWQPVDYRLIAPHTTEPTIVRDTDGALLMAFRPWTQAGSARPHALDIYRSADEGLSWEPIIQLEEFCFGSPVLLNQAADGTPYVATCRYREPLLHRRATREMLWLWPLSDDRRQLLDPLVIRDGTIEFGPPPNDSRWRLDHPAGTTVRLADGQWHHVLVYRGLEDAEMRTDAAPTPYTGCYVEEVLSDGPPTPRWQF